MRLHRLRRLAWLLPAALATLAWVLPASPAAAAGEAVEQVEPAVEAPPGGREEHVVVETGEHPFEAWRLPEDWRHPDGTFNQEALVAQQRKRLDALNQRLETDFRLTETAHYLIFSDAGERTDRLFATWSEALYEALRRQFRIGPKERVWDGKCVLMLFERRKTFVAHARVFDRFGASRAGAYFAVETASPDYPQLVHICIPLGRHDPRRLQELFAHEGTHAFFQLYKRPVDLPLWLHEGLAEFMTVVNDQSLKARKQSFAILHARRGTKLKGLFGRSAEAGLRYAEYSVAYTLVDFLMAAGRPKFKRFVDALKAGKDQEAALQEAYGWDLAELERRWRVYAVKVLAGGR